MENRFLKTTKQLAAILEIPVDSLRNHSKAGMPNAGKDTQGRCFYDLKEVYKWIGKNVSRNSTKARFRENIKHYVRGANAEESKGNMADKTRSEILETEGFRTVLARARVVEEDAFVAYKQTKDEILARELRKVYQDSLEARRKVEKDYPDIMKNLAEFRHIDQVTQEWGMVLNAVSTELDSIPKQLAPEVAILDDVSECYALLDQAIREVKQTLFDLKYEPVKNDL